MARRPRYRKKEQAPATIGLLYIVRVRLVDGHTKEKIKHRLLMVGCERGDIERKLTWIFDPLKYSEMAVVDVRKVTDKIHIVNTVIEQPSESITTPSIDRGGSTVVVGQ